jgi:hypothetical protein
MPAPTFRGNGTFTSGTTSVTADVTNTGRQLNDIIVIHIESANQGLAQAYTNLTNNGYARPANSNVVVGTAAAATATQTDIWWKRATGSEANVVLGDLGDHTLCVVAAFSNVITTGDPWDATVNIATSVATAQVNTRNVTTSTGNALICHFISSPRDAAAAHLNANPVLFNSSDEVEVTERYDFGTASGGGGTAGLITYRKPTAGAVANLRINTVTSNTSTIFTGALIALPDPSVYPWSQVVIL